MGDSAGGGVVQPALPCWHTIAVDPRSLNRPSSIRCWTIARRSPILSWVPFAGWTYEDNLTGWSALLGEAVGGPDVSLYAAPARATIVTDLPPVYIEVGELDIFRNECIEFARRTALAGVSTELHVHPGVPHGWDVVRAGRRTVTKRRVDRPHPATPERLGVPSGLKGPVHSNDR